MAAPPQLTVFVPAYNAGPYIAEALGSVLAQDGPSFEVLVIDDGSTDETLDVVQGLAASDDRIRILTNGGNRGIAHSANRALREARGRYLVRLDADDVAAPGRHRRLHEVLDGGTAQVVGSDIEVFGRQRAGTVAFPRGDGAIKARFLACANNVANSSSACDLSFVRARGLAYREDLLVAEDLAFWVDCMFAGASFANVAAPLIRVRSHDAQTTKRHLALMPRAREAVRRRLLLAWFPQQHEADRETLVRLLEGGDLSRQLLLAGVTALDLLLLDRGPSRYGEDRQALAAYLRMTRDACFKALADQPPPATARSRP
jgi:glycosyltransferase involved in cell wall biosynthesis